MDNKEKLKKAAQEKELAQKKENMKKKFGKTSLLPSWAQSSIREKFKK